MRRAGSTEAVHPAAPGTGRPRFEISVIERYFPEYAEEIHLRLP
jgi:hypothetical protein